MPLPRYACCFLWDGADGYWFEPRPVTASVAAGKLTCFGGSLEGGESPLQAIYREIGEELLITLSEPVVPVIDLFVEEQASMTWMARFYRAYCPLHSRPDSSLAV